MRPLSERAFAGRRVALRPLTEADASAALEAFRSDPKLAAFATDHYNALVAAGKAGLAAPTLQQRPGPAAPGGSG